ncbi:MAG: GNAT family N-acetyltransferase [Actinomycetia bacterium]|nr:GNAT family N-acetyltransferase [Actinomycetes bacterium]MCP4957735.1 GNAT family N-acetyltransferase [Actinomycetes bacterium]
MTVVRTASLDDLGEMSTVLGDAFYDDPIMTWVFPDAETRPRLLEAMFGFLAEYRYLPETLSTICQDAAALWSRPHTMPDDGFWEQRGGQFSEALEGQVERLGMVSDAISRRHPGDPHRYLLSIGVRSSAQGRGLGGLLMAHTLAEIDAAGECAYLEATSPRSRILYERHGFEVTDQIDIDGCPPMWPMWREARRS